MEIKFIDECSSTHLCLIDALKQGEIVVPVALCAKSQTNGVGSRGNSWQSLAGGLFLSMAVDKNSLPKDLPMVSIAIYFAMVIKQILSSHGSLVWVKWPNDLYVNDKKVGGLISTFVGDYCVISVGINLCLAPNDASSLDIDMDADLLALKICGSFDFLPSWGDIFTLFKAEFEKSRAFCSHAKSRVYDLSCAELLNDGSLKIGDERIYSLR
ncbi:biotin--[acetyl-CoA-carboxylase] ligase [Campylobacter sp. 19-13652]|uniref:biotin--[acetyl-CoA-carboxylase] ligase n=1 Tax=Campylobacter sp. 19-13652 TaxID=2840180 RepID=UPI001C788A5C|nr:biotin--[acetyl-CoA-carboxylase] ligase [Campylobacter sp. 19-13652]BCX78937.1 biotin--[acetyl-CoA-carboxylase] ligase [Campylobacter sp. 19-13652]